MAKTATIILRVDPETKAHIEESAAQQGKSVTSFVLDAAVKAATRPAVRAVLSAWLTTCCQEAAKGGAGGYQAVGRRLVESLTAECSQEQLHDLGQRIERADREAVWSWLAERLPHLADLIPERRRGQFVDGVLAAGRSFA